MHSLRCIHRTILGKAPPLCPYCSARAPSVGIADARCVPVWQTDSASAGQYQNRTCPVLALMAVSCVGRAEMSNYRKPLFADVMPPCRVHTRTYVTLDYNHAYTAKAKHEIQEHHTGTHTAETQNERTIKMSTSYLKSRKEKKNMLRKTMHTTYSI